MIDELRAHIEGKISAAELHRYPFPHLIVDGFFPEPVYREILRANPFAHAAGEEWKPRGRKPDKTGTPYWARRQLDFARGEPADFGDGASELWSALKECFLRDHWFERLVFRKYEEFFVLRFGELVEMPDFWTHFRKELFLQQHDPGYAIGPHTDIPTRVFTCIFSFADRPGFEEFGTELCVHKDPLARCWGNDHHAPEDFRVAKVAPYRPNGFLLFFKTRHSFHSVRAIDETVPNRRYGMQLQLYEPKGGLFTDLSEPDLLAVRLRSDLKTKLKRIWAIARE